MIASEIHRNVLNFILFQTGWLVCVLFPLLLFIRRALYTELETS